MGRMSDEEVAELLVDEPGSHADPLFCDDNCMAMDALARDLLDCRAAVAALRVELAEEVWRADENLAALERVTGWNAALRARAEWAEESTRINLQAVYALTDELGDAHADYDAAESRVALLEGLLREVEWAAQDVDYEPCCPVCDGLRYSATLPYGHEPDCRLAAALADAPRAGEGE